MNFKRRKLEEEEIGKYICQKPPLKTGGDLKIHCEN